MVDLYLVRHCAAQGNVDGKFQGRIDCDITELGRTQLELVSTRLRNVPFAAIYTSPLLRAKKTAEAINQYHHVPLRVEQGLIEIDLGAMDGLPWSALPEQFPQASDAWYHHPWDFAAPDGETMQQVYDRVWDAVQAIVQRENVPGTEKKICAVSHGCALRNFLCRAKGWPLRRMDDVPLSDNTAISEVRFADDGSCAVVRIGDASHLTPSLSVAKKMGWGAAKS